MNSPAEFVACVKGLLTGQPAADVSSLAYGLDAWHLGVLLHGAEAERLAGGIATSLDRRLLLVPGDTKDTVWAWLGGASRLDAETALDANEKSEWAGVTVAFGEPAQRLMGWRLTHRQAAAALSVAMRTGATTACYGKVALLACALKDELLASSLRSIYLAPLAAERDGGKALRETLRAYFAAERNVSAAAVVLGIKRHTVTNRLRTIEERLGRTLNRCAADIEMALRLEDLYRDPPVCPAWHD